MYYEKIQLEPGETILAQTRRHWFIIFMQLFSLLATALLPVILYFLVEYSIKDYFTIAEVYFPGLLFLYTIWLMIIWVSIFTIWTNYYLDVLTVTDRRIILINQKGFFRRNVSSFRLERLQDINVEINGIIATLLDFGTIEAQTAGHSEQEFRGVDLPNPRELKSKILEAADNLIASTPTHLASDL